MKYNDFRPRLKGNKKVAYDFINSRERRILVIGDIHAPFTLPQYLDFCKDMYARHNCNQVIFIGDIIDNHYASFHTTDPDGMGGGDELDLAIKHVKKWKKAFPVADVCIGNHDRIIMRKAFDSQIPSRWIKSYNEVLGTKWNWVEQIVYDGVQYVHGEGGTARTKCKNDMMSTVQGHIHTQAYTEWTVGKNFKIFGMQVGCGIDSKSYAAAYAKNFKKQAIGCGVVIGGHTAINCMMDL
ncbi:MAG: metallophosphoesterase [Flavobacteriaceae bacterium]|jgi:predicted phosphodiesterase